MGHGRNLRRGFVEDGAPELQDGQVIGKVVEIRDRGIVSMEVPSPGGEPSSAPHAANASTALAYLPPRFRGVLFLRRGSFVILAPSDCAGGERICWTIERLLRTDDIKQLRRDGVWPLLFDPAPNATPQALDDGDDGRDSEEGDTSE